MTHVFPHASDAGVLYVHRFLMRLALGLGVVFAWIFMFKALWIMSGNIISALFGIGILYGLSQGIVFLLTPLAGRALRFGLRRGLLWGTCAAFGAFFACMFLFVEDTPERVFSVIASFVILSALHRSFYWLPYRSLKNERLASRTNLLGEIVIALAPLLAGFLVTSTLGGIGLFGIAAGLLVLSFFPIFLINESYEPFAWGYRETYEVLFSKKERVLFAQSIFDGIQGVALLLFWPLVIFLVIGQSFWLLGIILSLTLLCTLFARLIMCSWVPHLQKLSLSVLSILTLSGWIFRLSAATPLTIVAADVFSHTTLSPRRMSIDILSFEQVADGGSFVDEYTALREMGMALGRIGGCALLVVGAFLFVPIVALALPILCAGFAALASLYFSRSVRIL